MEKLSAEPMSLLGLLRPVMMRDYADEQTFQRQLHHQSIHSQPDWQFITAVTLEMALAHPGK